MRFAALLLSCIGFANSREFYELIRLSISGDSNSPPTERAYLLMNNVARKISDLESITGLNLALENAMVLDYKSSERAFRIGDPLPSMAYKDKSPDDAMRMYILRSSVFNGNILINLTELGDYMNSSVTYFRGRLLMAASLQMGFTGSRHKYPTNNVEFRWVNHTNYPFYTEETYLGIENEIAELNMEIKGQDPRMIVHNDSFVQLFFTSILNGLQHQKMGVAELRYLSDHGRLNITYKAQPIIPGYPLDRSLNQKNWSPFIHGDEVYLVQSIHPFTVVRMEGYGLASIEAKIVSHIDYEFEYSIAGELRGGTNALRLDDFYLSFFHVRTKLPYNGMTTYVFGAYTFNLDPPFKLLSVSPTPIMPEGLYTQAWAGRFIDYCVYPMHIFMKDADTIHMSFGYQDKIGMIGEIRLSSLLRTLVAVAT